MYVPLFRIQKIEYFSSGSITLATRFRYSQNLISDQKKDEIQIQLHQVVYLRSLRNTIRTQLLKQYFFKIFDRLLHKFIEPLRIDRLNFFPDFRFVECKEFFQAILYLSI
jgi:hypothetical protein